MTGRIGSDATSKVIGRITGEGGINASLGELALPAFEAAQVRAQNVAPDLAERSGGAQYPAMHVYCEKVVNELKEKFRSFSGRAQMVVEVRHSQDRMEGLQGALESYADAATEALAAARGNWGDGMFYNGGYEVSYGAAKHGGRNFIQVAKVTFELQVSRD
jgi:hypothetical protein